MRSISRMASPVSPALNVLTEVTMASSEILKAPVPSAVCMMCDTGRLLASAHLDVSGFLGTGLYLSHPCLPRQQLVAARPIVVDFQLLFIGELNG